MLVDPGSCHLGEVDLLAPALVAEDGEGKDHGSGQQRGGDHEREAEAGDPMRTTLAGPGRSREPFPPARPSPGAGPAAR